MATAITAQAQPQYGRTIVTVDDPLAGDVVQRSAGSSGWQDARFATVKDDADLRVLVDYETPMDTPVAYRVMPTGLATAPVVLESLGRDWWKPLPYPSLSMPVQVVDGLQQLESETETQAMFPVGSAYPVLVAGTRRAWRGSVALATLARGEGDRLLEGLRRSPLVLFQPSGLPQAYLAVGTVKRRAFTRLRSDDTMLWQMEVQQIAPPALVWSYPAAATWGAYRDSGTTWAQWQGGSWLDVMLGSSLGAP